MQMTRSQCEVISNNTSNKYKLLKVLHCTLLVNNKLQKTYHLLLANDTEAVVRRCSVKKVFLEISQKFTGKHHCHNLLFNKFAGFRSATLLKSFWHRCFPVNFAKLLRTPFFAEHLLCLFLVIFLTLLEEL